ncbi:helix-turn-helix domain-containing protein [Flavobacterium sp. DG2-3]|uniref:helix-turn-helix domain-containing protein n=1 Tax=Flavobacterium sp. DG2-3 TaxID=3068317 RepID=UPI003530B7A1
MLKTVATVSRWCTNEVQPSVETLYEISKYLKVYVGVVGFYEIKKTLSYWKTFSIIQNFISLR